MESDFHVEIANSGSGGGDTRELSKWKVISIFARVFDLRVFLKSVEKRGIWLNYRENHTGDMETDQEGAQHPSISLCCAALDSSFIRLLRHKRPQEDLSIASLFLFCNLQRAPPSLKNVKGRGGLKSILI
ncbi:hypothetical protein LXL04_012807 [Taraxacum kok-saghyz]